MKHATSNAKAVISRLLAASVFLLGLGWGDATIAGAHQEKVQGSKNLAVLRLSADKLFVENSDALSTKGKGEIRKMIKDNGTLIMIPMIITGHTDRLGTHAYNQDLSFRRAEAVRRYIKAQGHFVRMDVAGMAETQPLVSCTGVTPLKKLIKCLAPNRRVEIERLYGVDS
ncbi:MAG: OmpA family protein [Sulfuricellaceae bacterium]